MASCTLTSLTTANQTLFEGEIGFVAATGGNLGVVTMANSVLLNHGTLYGNQEAILVTATDAYIENHGSITGGGIWG